MRPFTLGLITGGFKGGSIPGELEFFESGWSRKLIHIPIIRNFVLIVNGYSAE